MKTINNFDDALNYVFHLGFQGIGPISHRQQNLCDVTDRLVKAAKGYPYQVVFHRSIGEFEVNGKKVKPYEW